MFRELERFVVPLQEAIVETVNSKSEKKLPLDLLNSTTRDGESLLRALYYPAQKKVDESVTWASAHTDIDYLAILPRATEKGLQVLVKDQWRSVVVPPDAFIVNVGDMLENITNGLFTSARHRVKALEPDKDRFSMVLFVHPTGDTSLEPLPECVALTGGVQKYGPGTRNEFLWERLLELGIGGDSLLETYAKTGHAESQARFDRASPQVVQMLTDKGLASPELLQTLASRKSITT